VHRAGAAMLSHLLNQNRPAATAVACSCGEQVRYQGQRRRSVLTAVGEAAFERAYYYCPHCHRGQCPRDRELDVVDTGYSPGVRRMMALVGSETSFDRGRTQMELLAGLVVTRKAIERHSEAINVPHACACTFAPRLPAHPQPDGRTLPQPPILPIVSASAASDCLARPTRRQPPASGHPRLSSPLCNPHKSNTEPQFSSPHGPITFAARAASRSTHIADRETDATFCSHLF
jgi:hypothetical protein